MSIRFALLSSLLSLAIALPAHAGNGWSTVAYPLSGPPQAIGSYAAGCIAGAVTLPLIGDGYQVMRPSRNRYYGHPELTAFVTRLGHHAATRSQRLLIGDLGQPRGGPMPNGHRSHQIGLDVDVWFLEQPAGRVLSQQEIEQIDMPSMVIATEGILNPARWSPRYRDMLKVAAQAPEVDRIFVNPIIKQALCQTETERSWLNKVRPWWGHDAHFHIRLSCPADSPQCKPQKPFPSGDGCDDALARWAWETQQAALSPKSHPKPEPPSADDLPVACSAVLYSPSAQGIRQP